MCVQVYIDMHGHSRKYNAFLYGNDGAQSWSATDRAAADTAAGSDAAGGDSAPSSCTVSAHCFLPTSATRTHCSCCRKCSTT